MLIENLIKNGTKILKQKGINNYQLDAELLLTQITKKERVYSIINDKEKINNKDCLKYFDLISRRQKNEPIAYILNKKEFWGIDFFVNKNVLIPRPETEIILEDLKKRFKNKSKLNILDIGTGSGCIILSILKEFRNFIGTGIDKSVNSIKIALYNSNILQLNNRVKFINCDIDNYNFGKYDIIVSNPPYICSHKVRYLSKDIRDFEPLISLDGGATGLEVFKKVLIKTKKLLKIGGFLYLEIDHTQSKKIKVMLKKCKIRVISTLYDCNKQIRCIIGTRFK